MSPTRGTTPLTGDAALGVALNGLRIYGYIWGGETGEADLAHHQARQDTFQTGQLDVCGRQIADPFGYRYHTSSDAPISLDA